jgi:hypothetical protein
MTLLLIAQLISSAPPLPPAQAAAVLQRAAPDLEVRSNVTVSEPDGPTSIGIPSRVSDGPFGSFGPRPVVRPLNCCDVLTVPLPYTTVRVLREPHVAEPAERSFEGLRPAADVHHRRP